MPGKTIADRWNWMAMVSVGIFALCVAPADAAEPNQLTEDELAAGWLLLFDGQSLFGWRKEVEADWRVVDGAIEVTSGAVGLLRTTTQFGDYELQVDFKHQEQTNSGVFLHTPPRPRDPTDDCYELNIAAQGVSPFTTGSLVGRKKATAPATPGQWHTFAVTVRGGKINVKLNGQSVLSYADRRPLRRGFIGLQHNQGRVAFRNIKLRPLGLNSLFNGKDLTGWKTYPEMASKFTVTEEGWLNVKDGRGQLETERSFGDFTLQLECISHAKHLNSGIFFRCIPGDVMMGYECQIHNGFKEGDRTKPVDCGTGGIFRRQDARRVVADDLTWFPLTLIATGPHMAAWVRGIQVSDWTDTRDADPNPRRGLRTAPGTVMIQGHDPTTNLSFRKLRIGETVGRKSQ